MTYSPSPSPIVICICPYSEVAEVVDTSLGLLHGMEERGVELDLAFSPSLSLHTINLLANLVATLTLLKYVGYHLGQSFLF